MGQQTSKMKPKNLAELAQLTAFMQEDLAEWYKGFVVAYPNGAISIEDLKKIYRDHFPFGDSREFTQHVFQQFDTNGDGFIDFREFVTWLSVSISGTLDDRLQRAFTMYDLDGDGFVSRHEMTKILRSIYKMVGVVDESKSIRRVDDIFNKMDVNVDDRLSLEEFVEGTKQDAVVMNLLQCDWESNLIQNFGKKTSIGSKRPLSLALSAPLASKDVTTISRNQRINSD